LAVTDWRLWFLALSNAPPAKKQQENPAKASATRLPIYPTDILDESFG